MGSSEPDRDVVADWRAGLARQRSALAWSGSFIAHVALIYAASRMPWAMPEAERAAIRPVMWISDWPAPVAEDGTQPAPDETPLPTEPLPEPAPESAAEPTATEPVPTEVPRPDDVEPAPAADDTPAPSPNEAPSSTPESPPSTVVTESTVPEIPPGTDLEAVRERAIDDVFEQRRPEGAYLTFSFDDLPENAPPRREPLPDTEIFDAPSWRPPSLLSPNAARTRTGRWLGDVCNALTGGVGVFGLLTLCVEEQERPRYYSHLKPQYLTSRPECEEIEPQSVDGGRLIITQKCRLVPTGGPQEQSPEN